MGARARVGPPVRAAYAAVLAAVLILTGCSTPTPSGPAGSASATSASATTAPGSSATGTPAARAAAPVPPVPPVSARARAAGLRDVRTIVPDAVIDLRYATTHNFTHVRLYPAKARCLVHRSMARGLARAAAALRRAGHVLVFWDCYRPHAVQVRMYRVVADPAWVARPGPYARSHEAGRSVDVTVARRATTGSCTTSRVHGHCLLDMGTGFDNFTPRAHAYATTGVRARAERHRALLRTAMGRGGLIVYSGEWWHFDGPGAAVNRPHLHAPVY